MELLQLPLLRNLHINDNHLVQISNDLLVSGNRYQFCCVLIRTNPYFYLRFFLTEIGEANQGTIASLEFWQLSIGHGARSGHSAPIGCDEHFE